MEGQPVPASGRHPDSDGRHPGDLDRSQATFYYDVGSPEAYLDFVRRHRAMGFTDFTTVRPAPEHADVLRVIARDVIPDLRAGRLLD